MPILAILQREELDMEAAAKASACKTFRQSRTRGTCTSIPQTCANSFLKRDKNSIIEGCTVPLCTLLRRPKAQHSLAFVCCPKAQYPLTRKLRVPMQTRRQAPLHLPARASSGKRRQARSMARTRWRDATRVTATMVETRYTTAPAQNGAAMVLQGLRQAVPTKDWRHDGAEVQRCGQLPPR